MSTDYIVCKRTSTPRYRRGDIVIRSTATNEAQSAVFQHYADRAGYAYIRYGEDQPIMTRLDGLMHIDDWREARKEQASIKNYCQ